MSGAGVLALLLLGAAAGPGGRPPSDAARVDAALEALLASDEYRHLRRYREDTAERPADEAAPTGRHPTRPDSPARADAGRERAAPALTLPDLSGLAGAMKLLLYAVLAATLAWVTWLAVGAWRGRQRDAPAEDGAAAAPAALGTPPGEQEPDEWLRQATAQARAGRYREAVRLLLLGAMSVVERRGLIRHRRGLTNHDYLRALEREPRLRAALEPIVAAFDEIHFGRRPAGAERFDECLRHYRAGFRAS